MELEKRVLEFWQKEEIFKKSLKSRARGKKFVFYDGPPFATGLPHYGHILAGTIKDAIPRYQTMRGKYVRREWGWDCHGLPLENVVEAELGLKHKKDIEKFGIENFNSAAKNAVLRYEHDWKNVIPKTGRFVEMENPYKTMDSNYTESVWWSFKTLWDKKLIYEGYKVMYVCPRCETSLAQSEVTGSYKDLTDISVTVKFELVDDPKTYLLAWTTTPWTLPGNTAIAINKAVKYSLVKSIDSKYVVASDLVNKVFKENEFTVEREFIGKDLVGKSYLPPYDYYKKDKSLKNYENGWKVWHADFVTTDAGTGIAHEAPAFGDDDMQLAVKNNVPIIQHIGMDGKMKDEVLDFKGLYVKQKGDNQSTDIEVIKNLAHKGLLFSKEKIVHSYPLCWRCDTPLLNYATSSWFVKVTDFKDRLIKENKKINWTPSHMRDGRFGKWLESARDWAISRTRFWGAPIPVWKCEECNKHKVMGSLSDLEKCSHKSGNKYVVMRHGESHGNVADIASSDPMKSDLLTARGKIQVEKSATKLKKEKIDLIITSDFARTKETAEIIARVLGISVDKIITDKRLREINTGDFHSRPNRDYHSYFSGLEEKFTKAPPNGGTLNDLRVATGDLMVELESKYKDKNIVLVTHEYTSWMIFSNGSGASTKESVDMKTKKDEFLNNAEFRKLDWRNIPRNNHYELDYHKPYIDEISLHCDCGGNMKRIPDVFDCWFESGSMPYGQFHYPFENKKTFKDNFPADFIAEGLDQTRGWFYSMIVLGVGLFGKAPYKHVLVNGLVLAEDGQKMSKKLKNYPDVLEVIEKYGADSLRLYMLSSPIMRGEDLNFSEKGLAEIYRKNVSRLLNVYTFYETYRHELKNINSYSKSKNVLDLWILSRLGELHKSVTENMDKYELDTATRPIEDFIDDLSTWYLRRSRERFKGDDLKDKDFALSTIRFVLIELSKIIAPFMPFVAEDIYQKLREKRDVESVHLEDWPKNKKVDKKIITKMTMTRKVVELALSTRSENGIKVRQPLSSLTVRTEANNFFSDLVSDEVNVKKVIFSKGVGLDTKLDIEITDELKEEGNLRDLIRTIQDLRKKKGMTPRDMAVLIVDAQEQSREFISKFEKDLKKTTQLKDIKFEKNDGEEIKIDNLSFVVSIS